MHKILASRDASLPARIASVYDYSYRPGFVCQLVSSQLDVDRCDYLLRDSLMTGAKYGMYDLEWILRHLQLDADGQRVYVGNKGLYAVEEYLQARYYMFRQVYFHRSLRAAEAVLLSTLRRAVELLEEGKLGFHIEGSVLERVLRREPLDVVQYLELDDHDLIFHIKQWRRDSDPVLADLSRRFVDRDLFKTIDVDFAGDREQELVVAAREAVAAAGFDPTYYFVHDSASDIPYYGYYAPDADDPRMNIYVETGGSGPRDTGDQRDLASRSRDARLPDSSALLPERGDASGLRHRARHRLDLMFGGLVRAAIACVLAIHSVGTGSPSQAQTAAVLDVGDAATRSALADAVGRAGFRIVDIARVDAACRGAGYSGSVNLTLDEAHRLALAVGADVLVLGVASIVERAGSAGRPRFVDAFLGAFLVDGASGRLLSYVGLRGEGPDGDAARARLVGRVGDGISAWATLAAEAEASRLDGTNALPWSPSAIDVGVDTGGDGSVSPPRFFQKPAPRFTDDADRAHAVATVDLLVQFNADGTYGPIEVRRWAGFGLDAEAIDAVRARKFWPARRGNEPVTTRALLRYNFRFRDR